jgi:hypothetical protein
MKGTTRSASGWMLSAFAAVIGGLFSVCSTPAVGQGSQGQDAVYNSSNGIVGSSAFIDASVFANSPPPPLNFCTVLNYVLTHSFPAVGAVVDTRGLPFTNPPTSMTCTMSPWGSGSSYVNVPSTILAGGPDLRGIN